MRKKDFGDWLIEEGNSLIIAAGKKIKEDAAQLTMGFIGHYEEKNKYVMMGYVSNSPKQVWVCLCNTKDGAIEVLHELGEKFPPSQDINIIFGRCKNG